VVPLSQLKSTFPVLRTIGHKKAAGFTLEQWRYAFTNTFTEEESRALYERYHIRHRCGSCGGSALATLEPGHQDIFVNYKNDDRAPLLFISGGEDHLMPPSLQRSNARHYKSSTVTEVKEYTGYAHLLPAQKGWEQIAADALARAVEHER
jgi:pimeloyl-ACP methyl ester carboxylesterase